MIANQDTLSPDQPGISSVERLGQLAISSFLKPSSKDNIFNAFFKSTYLKDSWVHYSLTQPVPNITYRHLKLAMSFMLISIILQLRYSKETRLWAKSFIHKGLLVASLIGMSTVSLITVVKFLIDKSRETREREEASRR